MDEEGGLRLETQPVTSRQVRSTPGRVEVELSFPSPRRTPYPENGTAFALHLKRPGRELPLLLIIPGWRRGPWRIEQFLAQGLLRRGVESCLLTMPLHGQRSPAGHPNGSLVITDNVDWTRDNFLQSLRDIRRLLLHFREVSPHRPIGLLGLSLGGLIALRSLSREKFDAGIAVLAMGDPAAALWHSPKTARCRRTLESRGITLDLLRQRWEAIDPVHTLKAGRFATQRLFLLNGHKKTHPGDIFLQEVEKHLPGAQCLPIRFPYRATVLHAFAYAFLPLRARRIARLFLSTLSARE